MAGVVDQLRKMSMRKNFIEHMNMTYSKVEVGSPQWKTMELLWMSCSWQLLLNLRDMMGREEIPENFAVGTLQRWLDESETFIGEALKHKDPHLFAKPKDHPNAN